MSKKSTKESRNDTAPQSGTAATVRSDGWMNLFTSMGTNKDRLTRTKFGMLARIDRVQLEQIYRSDGLGRRIIDTVPQDGTREWIDIEGDPDGAILKELQRLKAKQEFRNLWRWARLYGGAIMVMGVDDGKSLEAPLDPERPVRKVIFLRVYDRWQVTWNSADINNDPASEFFGEPEWYRVTPYGAGVDNFRVHRSRTVEMHGETLPERERIRNNGWGDSTLQSVYEALRDVGTAYNGAANILTDFITTILSVENLAEMIAAGQEDVVKKRLEIIDLSRSILNTVILDKNEQYNKQASSIAGLPDLLDRFGLFLCGVTGIPATKLFGRSPAGMNATGEADLRNYYDDIKSEQEDRLLDPITKLKDLLVTARDGEIKSQNTDDFQVKFRSLWQLTDKEIADTRKVVADTDKLYVDMGAVDPVEIAKSRFGGERYSMETEIDVELRESVKLTEEDIKPQPVDFGLPNPRDPDDPNNPNNPDDPNAPQNQPPRNRPPGEDPEDDDE